MIDLIVTHPGSAHKDDLLAVSLLIAKSNAPVARRAPTALEREDPHVAVVDIGEEYDSAKLNFDHHQFPRESPPACALSLVLKHLGLYDDALRFCDWLETAEWLDSRGPDKTATWLGAPRRVVSQLASPIDMTVLRRFASETELRDGEPLYEVLKWIGTDLLEYLRLVRERIELVKKHSERWSIPSGKDVIEVVFLPRLEPLPSEPSVAVSDYIRSAGLEETVCAVVYPDRRGPGYGVGRYRDHPRLDFCRVENEEDVHFAHRSGFMCKTSASEPSRLRALIAMAWE